jgi:hypothetical protein
MQQHSVQKLGLLDPLRRRLLSSVDGAVTPSILAV